jgi:NADP-dependent aldehyde dehydrogenase
MLELSGRSIIGFRRGAVGEACFRGEDAATGERLEPDYYVASDLEVDLAVTLASRAFESYRNTSGKTRGAFLRSIAANIESLGEILVQRATRETALPVGRISSETARTCFQLRMFAALVEEGSWVDARIDLADPARQPLRKPDVRSMFRPVGPVIVFCASNFPLAFSVAGGDTASALAAGNPVVVKAHHAHPGTAELIGLAISDAVRECDLPEGLFSLVYGPGKKVGTQLINHPLIKAGGFTGSRSGGSELMKLAAARPEPIPFFAEMSSVNPIFILPGALQERSEQIASGLHASVTLGAGQFCTNPGLVFVPAAGSSNLIESLKEKLEATPSFDMLNAQISSAYRQGVSVRAQETSVELLTEPLGTSNKAALFVTKAESFFADPELQSEIFGPATLLIIYSDTSTLPAIARSLEGQLTATVHAADSELGRYAELLAVLEERAGRIVWNGFPTGVEVGPAMVHGGPFPATSDGRSTSVGTRAVFRFVRPVCYQDAPDATLPDELKNSNPLRILRLVDGEVTKSELES